MDDAAMDDMFDELITPNMIPQIDIQLAPMIISGYGHLMHLISGSVYNCIYIFSDQDFANFFC